MPQKGAINCLWCMRINHLLMDHSQVVFLVWEKLLFLLSNMAAVTSAIKEEYELGDLDLQTKGSAK